MPPTEKHARGAKTQALNKLATLKTVLAPKKPATPKQLAALKKATATKKQKAEQSKIRRQQEQKKRDAKKQRRRERKELDDIMRELPYGNHKYDRNKVEMAVLDGAFTYMLTQQIYPYSEQWNTIFHGKCCEFAHEIMEEFRAHKEQLRRKRRKGKSFR